jgi:hypothetical protein
MTTNSITWPDGKRFAFTVFDDTDSQTLEKCRAVYGLLGDLGFRTTKSVWPVRGKGKPSDCGATCDEPDYREYAQSLQREGFEIGYHMATSHTSTREETIHGLDQFARHFGHYPVTMANHYFSNEDIYFGDARLTGVNRFAYNLLTRFKNRNRFRGHVEGDPLFWGDLCRERIKYVRNFSFAEINTLKICPQMPYHDPDRPYVNLWYASTEGAMAPSFIAALAEANQDRLEAEGGACIMYTHFGLGFYENGRMNRRFAELMTRLSRKNGWFVPVATLLDYIVSVRGPVTLSASDRARLERKWLLHKVRYGTN